jgi:hypothetical protein
MGFVVKFLLAAAIGTAAAMAGKAYSVWSMERMLRSAAANAAAPGIDLKEFECRHYGKCDRTPGAR